MTDTLTIDTSQLATWRANPEFDYSSEFMHSDFSLLDWLGRHLDKLFGSLFGDLFSSDWGITVWYVVGLVATVSIVIFLFYRHPELLHIKRNNTPLEYDIESDNIYGVDFPLEIARAMDASDWRAAVRLAYLQTLRMLSDAHLIDWQLSKTPSQYVVEYADDGFRDMTNMFLRVRYGGFAATESMARAMVDGSHNIESAIEGMRKEKGGRQ